jgi:ubiquinone/menaquinone biosynthesis C-methylase UbiE
MLAEYYRKRASEYDDIYTTAVWQSELPVLHDWLVARARGRTILEVAAGTGYWTAVAASVANAIIATDINAEMLAIASAKHFGENVALVRADCWRLPRFAMSFEVGMAHLWWSHVRKQDRSRFLSHFAAPLQPRATLLMIDQNHVEDFGLPVSRRDAAGNSYQKRWLDNGERFEIVKNFPDAAELARSVEDACENVEILQLTHFWALSATFRLAAA